MESDFIEDRRTGLENFCKEITGLKYIYYSAEFQLFLRFTGTELEKSLNTFTKVEVLDLLTKYQHTFSFLSGVNFCLFQKEIDTELIVKISNFHEFIQKSKVMLEV